MYIPSVSDMGERKVSGTHILTIVIRVMLSCQAAMVRAASVNDPAMQTAGLNPAVYRYATGINPVAQWSQAARRSHANSGRRLRNWSFSRATMLECIWLTRDSLRPSVWPISFIVSSS